MKKYLILILLFAVIKGYSQIKPVVYFDKNGMYVEDSLLAESKIVNRDISKKRFELVLFEKRNNRWFEGMYKQIVKKEDENRFSIQIIDRYESVLKKFKLELVETTTNGFLIRKYQNKKCIEEVEALSVFPLVHHGVSKSYSLDNQDIIQVSHLYKDVVFKHFPQPALVEMYKEFLPVNEADQIPLFPGGEKVFYSCLTSNLKFPDHIKVKDLQGTYFVSGIIDTSGVMKNVQVAIGDNSEIKEVIYSAFKESLMPWKPALKAEKPVEYEYLFPLVFSTKKKSEFDDIKMPEYQGGEMRLRRHIAERIIYPVSAQKRGDQGKVFVNFDVNENGEVINAKIVKSVDFDLDNEALRVVKTLRNWIPGEKDGKKVCVSYTVPINFVLR